MPPRLTDAVLRPSDRLLAVACSLVFLGLVLTHTLVAPTFRGPDEPHHFDLVREWSIDHDYDVVSRQISSQVMEALPLVDYYERSEHLQQDAAPARADRPRFDQLGPDEPSAAYNQISQHPPLYNVVYGTIVEAIDLVEPGPRWAYDREVGLVRVLTALMLAPVPAMVVLAARRLGATQAAAVVAGLVPSITPQFTHIGALVSNDNLLTLLAAVELLLLARVLAGGERRRWEDWAVGVVAGLLLITKAFAIAVCASVALGYLVRWRRDRSSLRTAGLQSAIVGGSALLAGGWWYLRNLAAEGQVQPTRGIPQLPRAPESFDPDPGQWFDTFRTLLPLRFFGDFGWFDVSIGSGWVGVSLVVIAVGVGGALLFPSGRGAVSRAHVGVLLVPVLVTLLVTAFNSWSGYTKTGLFPAIQGRYLFIGLPAAAVVLGVGWTRLVGRFADVLPLVALVAVVAFQFEGLTTMLEFYWGPPGGTLRDQLAAMATWSPWPRGVTLAFLALPLVTGAVLAVLLAGMAWRRPEAAPAER